MSDYRVYIEDTDGNLTSTGILFDPNKEELQRIRKRRVLTDCQKSIINKNNELKEYSQQLGGYVNMHYVRKELLLNKLNIDRADISRIIYLSTFIDYNDREENLLCKKGLYNKLEPMTKRDIKYVLKLKDTAFYSFIKEMKRLNLLFEANEKYYLSSEYFNKGKVDFKNKEYTRVFIYPTRYLYESCKPIKHKQLSYIFQLVPFMNYETNIICSNPGETDFYKLEKLNLIQICKLLGVSTENKQTMYKLKNDLLKFYIEINGNKYYFLSYINVQNGFGIKDYFAINPNVIWGGNNTSEIKELIKLMFFK
ncbi:MAG: hypothetical protein ACRCX2_10855 [Paraclostridium sp.]